MHEPIITEALFDEVQEVLSGRRRKQSYKICAKDELPLRGFLICPRCKAKLTGSASTGGSGIKQFYYHCSRGCKERVKADVVNDAFSDFLRNIHFKSGIEKIYNQILLQLFKSKSDEKAANQKTLQVEIEKFKERLNRAQQLMLDGEMEMSEYREIKRKTLPGLDM